MKGLRQGCVTQHMVAFLNKGSFSFLLLSKGEAAKHVAANPPPTSGIMEMVLLMSWEEDSHMEWMLSGEGASAQHLHVVRAFLTSRLPASPGCEYHSCLSDQERLQERYTGFLLGALVLSPHAHLLRLQLWI